MANRIEHKLHRALGLGPLVFYGVGMILGAGIYSVIGPAAGLAEESLWLSFVIGAIVSLLTGLSYAELATMFPDAGAEFTYLRKAFPEKRWLAFAIGMMMIMVGAVTAATVSIAFANYWNVLFGHSQFIVSIALILVVTLINIAGIRESSGFNIVLTLVEALGLVLVIYAGATYPDKMMKALSTGPSVGTMHATALIFFSYLGFQNIVSLAEEAKDPHRNIPRAILISIAVTAVLYVLVGLAVVALQTPSQLAVSQAPLIDAITSVSPRLVGILGAIALFATANTALIAILVASRVLFSMARAGELPAMLSHVRIKNKTPWMATSVVFVMALVLLTVGTLESTASLASLGSLIAFFSVHCTVIVLRRRDPLTNRAFKIPSFGGRILLIPMLGMILTIALISQFKLAILLQGLIIVMFILIIFWSLKWYERFHSG